MTIMLSALAEIRADIKHAEDILARQHADDSSPQLAIAYALLALARASVAEYDD